MKPEQITAWALDEASAEERQQLEATLLENPQQKQTAEETKAFCDFLFSELRDDSLALTDAQRERLVGQSSRLPAASKTPAPPPASRTPQTKWNIGIIVRLAVAACVALGGYWTWQAYTLNQRASHVVVAADAPSMKVNLPQAGDAKKKQKQDSGVQTRLLASAPVKAAIKEQPAAGKPLPAAPMPTPVTAPAALALSKQQIVMSPGDVEKLKQIQDQNAYALNFGDSTKMPALAPIGVQAQKSETVAGTGALVPSEGSGVLVGSGGILPHGAGMLTLNGGGALTVGGAVSHSSGGRLTVLSSTSAQLKQAQERPASSLNLKGGIFPEQMALADLSSDMMAIDGFIDLSAKTTMGTFNGRTPMPPARVSPQKTGIVYCLTQPSPGMVYGVRADGCKRHSKCLLRPVASSTSWQTSYGNEHDIDSLEDSARRAGAYTAATA